MCCRVSYNLMLKIYIIILSRGRTCLQYKLIKRVFNCQNLSHHIYIYSHVESYSTYKFTKLLFANNIQTNKNKSIVMFNKNKCHINFHESSIFKLKTMHDVQLN